MNPQKFNKILRKIKDDKQTIIPIYEEYYPKIIVHLRCRFGKTICHEDVAQKVFLALLEPREYMYIKSPTQWLFAMADNKAIDLLRARHEEIAYSDDLYPQGERDYSYLRSEIRSALEQLDPLSRDILYMHFWEGYSHKEIAAILHLSNENVRTKASRAYKILKEYL